MQVKREPDEEDSYPLLVSGFDWALGCTSDRIRDLKRLELTITCLDRSGAIWTVNFNCVFETATVSGRQTSVTEGMRYLVDMEAWTVRIDPASYGAQCLDANAVALGLFGTRWLMQEWQLPSGLKPATPGATYYGSTTTRPFDLPLP